MSRGWTLIELMIVVAMLGIAGAAAWSTYTVVDAPGSSGYAAHRTRAATELLVEAQQQSLLLPLTVGETALPSRLTSVALRRIVTARSPGLFEVRLEATWPVGTRIERLVLVSARAVSP
jgi:prepilin-type N-terminal cleavage/methylation domain-containing protein